MEKDKGGRPKIEIDWEQFDKLCTLQCTLIEIASYFECSEDTIERRVKEGKGEGFADYYKKKSAGGKASLRRAQFKGALAGNATLQIWLGKQYLGQADKQELTGKDGGAIESKWTVEIVKAEDKD